MTQLKALMDDFHAAILDKEAEAFVPRIAPNPRLSPKAQMEIYVEGYRLRLLEAIAADYPATLDLLGREAFDALALGFIEANPPTSYSLDPYPFAFADYLREHGDDAFAADLAHLESVIARVFVLPGSEPLAAASLNLSPEAFAQTVLAPRNASQLLALRYPVEAYLRDWRQGNAPTRPEAHPCHLFLVRHHNEVKRHMLTPAEHAVLAQLVQGAAIGAALEGIADAQPEWLEEIAANVQHWFARWTSEGFFNAMEDV